MSSLRLKLKLFFTPKLLTFMVLGGSIGYLCVDHYVEAVAQALQFSGPWKPLEEFYQNLILDRGSRAVWLWTLLPARIAWMVVAREVRTHERLLG